MCWQYSGWCSPGCVCLHCCWSAVHCWLFFILLCTRAYSNEQLPTQSVHSLYCYVGLFQLQDFIFVKTCAVFVVPSLYGKSFFWPIYLLPVQCHSQILCGCNSIQVVLSWTRPSASLWATLLMEICLFVFEPLPCLGKGSLAGSPPILCSVCQVHFLPACQQRHCRAVVKDAEIKVAYTALKTKHWTFWVLYFMYVYILVVWLYGKLR